MERCFAFLYLACETKVGPIPSHSDIAAQHDQTVYTESIYSKFIGAEKSSDGKVELTIGSAKDCNSCKLTTSRGPTCLFPGGKLIITRDQPFEML